jgi:hypothetical protein
MNLCTPIAMLLLLLTPAFADAQQKAPQETRNAALRYWMAFAEMKDPASDKTTQDLLEKTAAGDTTWDEAKLGPILDVNANAIAIFQRATKLPDCDWGLEYSQGPRASIAYAPRARVIARLNTLQGMREMSKGHSQTAVDTWLDGIRFTNHLARGGSLIFALIAKSSLLPNLNVLAAEAGRGHLNASQKQQIAAAIKTFPQDGFDWPAAWNQEASSSTQFFEDLRKSANPQYAYEEMLGHPAPEHGLPPNPPEIQAYRDYMTKVQSALHLPPAQTKTNLDSLESEEQRLTQMERSTIPSPQKVNEARAEIVSAYQALFQSLNQK